MRLVKRARLCAIMFRPNQAVLAPKRPDGMWFSPSPYLMSRMAFSTSAWRVVGLELNGGAIAVGHEGVVGPVDQAGPPGNPGWGGPAAR